MCMRFIAALPVVTLIVDEDGFLVFKRKREAVVAIDPDGPMAFQIGFAAIYMLSEQFAQTSWATLERGEADSVSDDR